jgi:hypothetical protein
MPDDAIRQRRHDGAAVRGQPALAADADPVGSHDQILDQEILIALEARSGRSSSVHDTLLMDDQVRGFGAPPPGLAAGRRRCVGVHAARLARLDGWTPFEVLEPGDLLALGRHRSFQLGDAAQQLQHQPLQIGVRQAIKIRGR